VKTELATNLQHQAPKILAELHQSKEPILITEQGSPSAYLVNVTDYEQMLERMKLLEGIAKGEKAIQEGQVLSHDEAKEAMKKWLK
jgi:prevent-host-death family protein